MPLMIEIKSGDKLIINGAVIENTGPNTKLLVHNQVSILRQKEIMSEEDNMTPAARIYFALQCAYIFPQKQAQYLSVFDEYIRQFLDASHSSAPIVSRIVEAVRKNRLYQGLKAAQDLLKHERELMDLVKQGDKDVAPAEEKASG